jgi:hypothetical protein
MTSARWVTLTVAASSLDMAATALRRTVERRARLAEDGVLEAAFDGIRARKFAGRWRIHLGPGWSREEAVSNDNKDPLCATFPPRPKHASRPEKE